MSVTRIPFASTAPSSAPLRRCIRSTAARMGLSPFRVTVLLNHFLDELAHEVSLGRTVRLPGFGSFSARYYASSRTCAPRFKASKALRLQSRHSAPLDLASQPPSNDASLDLRAETAQRRRAEGARSSLGTRR